MFSKNARKETKILRKVIASSLTVALLALFAAPVVLAQVPTAPTPPDGQSVGNFQNTPVAGQPDTSDAQGTLTQGTVAEGSSQLGAEGRVLRDYTVSTSGSGSASTVLFSSVDIAGFQPTNRLEGAGTSNLVLRGTGAVLSITDNINSLLSVKATGTASQTVTFTGPSGVTFSKVVGASTDNVWEVRSSTQGRASGTLILVGQQGQTAANQVGSFASDTSSKLTATIQGGAELVFRANSAYAAQGSAAASAETAHNAAVTSAVAQGTIATEATSEFSGGSLLANTNYFSSITGRTEASSAQRITTQLTAHASSAAGSGSANAGSVVAYDADYAHIPAQASKEVAVYVDGALAARAGSASQVAQMAADGKAAFHATTVDDRVLVLASTPSRAESHTVTVARVADSSLAAKTLAQLDAQQGLVAQVTGSVSLLGSLGSAPAGSGSGEVVGSFTSYFASETPGNAGVQEYTDVRSGMEVFSRISFAAQAASSATGDVRPGAPSVAAPSPGVPNPPAAQMDTSVAGQVVAQASFIDAAQDAIVAQAKAATTAEFVLSRGISASSVSQGVVKLNGPSGTVGYLITAQTDGSPPSASPPQMDTSAAGKVTAALQSGQSVIYRGASDVQAKANAEIIAKAIAAGQVASEVNVGLVANAVSGADIDYTSAANAALNTAASHRGLVVVDVASTASQAGAVVVNADKASLAAESASDVTAKVNGAPAVPAASAAEVLASASGSAGAAGGQAKYFVDANAQGGTQVLASLPSLASGQAAKLELTSELQAKAQSLAAVDVFGAFKAGAGGSATGSIVSSVVRPDLGVVLDYTVTARSTAAQAQGTVTKVFDSVQVASASGQVQSMSSASAASPNALSFTSASGASLQMFDTSSAVLKVSSAVAGAAQTVNFDLASNIQAQAAGSGDVAGKIIMLNADDFSGALILAKSTGDGAVATGARFDTAAQAQGQIEAQLGSGTQVIFKAFSGFEAELSPQEKQAQAEAIAHGKLLGQVVVMTDTVSKTTQAASVNYFGDVKAIVQVASADKVEILVDSASSVGKSLILSLDKNTVSGFAKGDAELFVDGDSVKQAASYSQALSASADSYRALGVAGGADVGFQTLVSLEHFSTRTITLQKPPPVNIYIFTTIALAVVVVGQAIIPRLRAKGKQKQW